MTSIKDEILAIVLKPRIDMRIIGSILCLMFVIQASHIYGQNPTTFAVIGDFGSGNTDEENVANRVKSWNPDFIVTVGDNNYPVGSAATIDENIGQYYHDYIFPYTGTYGAGATTNRFFPALGNHDWDTANAQPSIDYFTLPGNERYYDFVEGPVHFFVLDSDSREPDGISSTSVQGNWLQNKLLTSTAQWKIVITHHPPYSSRTSYSIMQWPFQQWGATAVIAGHAHLYERVVLNGFPYFINGLGGESTGTFGTPIPGSEVRFGSDFGAQLVTADNDSITFQFITHTGVVIDTYTVSNVPLIAPDNLVATPISNNQVNLVWTDNSTNEDGFTVERCEGAGCSNFVGIAQALANTNVYSDSSGVADTTYNYRVKAFNSGGTSPYSNSAEATTAAPGSTFFADDFNDGVQDLNKWQIGILSRGSSSFDPLMPVIEQNGNLTISPRPSTAGNNYSGYLSVGSWDLTEALPEVEVIQIVQGNAATIFSAGIDKNNWFSFRAKGSTLYLEHRVSSSTSKITISYDPVAHRFLRFRNDTVTSLMNFETSPDGSTWTTRRTVSPQFAITALKIELVGATKEAIANPGSALFDNFQLVGSNIIPPIAPSDLFANAVSSSEVNLIWTDNSEDETSFGIERCQGAACTMFSEIAQVGPGVSTYDDSGLSAITDYRYRVRAYRGNTNSDYSDTADIQTPPPAPMPPEEPSNLEITDVTANQIDLSWVINSSDEDGFKVERCQNSGCANFVEIGQTGIDENVYIDLGLTENILYRYRVRAFNTVGNSDYSNIVEAIAQNPPSPPLPPDGLAATPVSTTQIDLSWSDNSNNEMGFKIERCQNSGCTAFVEINQVAADATSYNDSGLTSSTLYRYRVRAYNIGGDSAYSGEAEATTNAAPPLAPDNLITTGVSPTQVDLAWSDNSTNEDGFKIERCSSAGCTTFAEIAQVGANVNSFTDLTVQPNNNYDYRVRAFNAIDDSGYSNIVNADTTVSQDLFSDNFDDNVQDFSKWEIGILSRGASSYNPAVQVNEQNGQLSITPLTSTTGRSYNGYRSAATWDLTDATAVVELVQKTSGNAVSIFSVGIDNNNWFSFRAKGKRLYIENRVLGSTTKTNATYNAVQHRFLRFRHDVSADAVVLETSPDEITWTIQRTVLREIDITAVKFELVAGTGGSVNTPGNAIFDNFRLYPNGAPFAFGDLAFPKESFVFRPFNIWEIQNTGVRKDAALGLVNFR